MQLSSHAGAAALPPSAAKRLVGLVSVRGREGRVVRRLGRLARLRLQLGHPRRQRLNLRHQFRVDRQCRVQLRPERHDKRVFIRIGNLAKVGQRWSVSHLYLDSCSRSSIKKNQHLGIKLAKIPFVEPPRGPQVSNYDIPESPKSMLITSPSLRASMSPITISFMHLTWLIGAVWHTNMITSAMISIIFRICVVI